MTKRRTRLRTDEGFALLTVIGSMGIITLFLLSSLAYVLASTTPSRASQDDKSAVAAAQAGIDEYLSRLTANDTYWATEDCNNLALPQTATCTAPRPAAGVAIPGTSGAATFSYRLLSTTASTTADGTIRLAVTGRSRGRSRQLTADLSPSGFLEYIYVSDFEVLDPAFSSYLRATVNGSSGYSIQAGNGSNTHTENIVYYTAPAATDPICGGQHWYEGRSAPSYTSGTYYDYNTFTGAATTRSASSTNVVAFSCDEISFQAGDKINGPLHTNDALYLDGTPSALFTSDKTFSAWASPSPDPTKLWHGPGSPDPAGYLPVYQPPLMMPASNSALVAAAQTSATGCVYSGNTRIAFTSDGRMSVKSPSTTGSVPRCYSGSGGTEVKDLPSVIYVQDTTATCTTGNVGYPAPASGSTLAEATGGKTTTYDCRKGMAFVSGTVKGRVTVATSSDVVVVGNTTYAGGLTGTDALGLIPQNFAWIYHPVDSSGANIPLPGGPVTLLDAAVLSVSHSLVVQNYDKGAAISTPTSNRLRVRGAIAQRYRGVVGTTPTPTTATGYLKDYQFDPRLAKAPPPYFLKPVNSPYYVAKVSG